MATPGISVVVEAAAMKRKLRQLEKSGGRAVEEALNLGALRLEREFTLVLSTRWGPRTGIEYSRQKGKKVHVASAKGEPPAPDTGNLLGHVGHEVRGDEAEVGIAGVDYAKHLIDPLERPFVELAWEGARSDVEDIIAQSLRRAVLR